MLNFNWIADLPLGWARILVIAPFFIAMVFALLLPKAYVQLGAEDRKPWRNLKVWVVFIVFFQVSIYFIF